CICDGVNHDRASPDLARRFAVSIITLKDERPLRQPPVELAESGTSGYVQRAAPAALVAIDGPVASGKTAVGHGLAPDLGYRPVDTGLMYRAVTWLAPERGIEPSDEPALAE